MVCDSFGQIHVIDISQPTVNHISLFSPSRVFTNKEPDEVSIIETPYGGRLVFVMPEGNMLYVHLKDKALIRNKKRWSQVNVKALFLSMKNHSIINYLPEPD